MNIPIEKLRENVHQLANKKATIIACCMDGAKSWYAKNLLDSIGYKYVYDAGSWKKLNRRIQKP
jgi:rhodanese-related sulfurtransferase